MKQVWFAWRPVVTEQNRIAWLRKVVRVWAEDCHHWADISGYSGYDPGWKYHG